MSGTDSESELEPILFALQPIYREPPPGRMTPVGYMKCDACGVVVGNGYGAGLCLYCVQLIVGGGPLRDLLREESRRARREAKS